MSTHSNDEYRKFGRKIRDHYKATETHTTKLDTLALDKASLFTQGAATLELDPENDAAHMNLVLKPVGLDDIAYSNEKDAGRKRAMAARRAEITKWCLPRVYTHWPEASKMIEAVYDGTDETITADLRKRLDKRTNVQGKVATQLRDKQPLTRELVHGCAIKPEPEQDWHKIVNTHLGNLVNALWKLDKDRKMGKGSEEARKALVQECRRLAEPVLIAKLNPAAVTEPEPAPAPQPQPEPVATSDQPAFDPAEYAEFQKFMAFKRATSA